VRTTLRNRETGILLVGEGSGGDEVGPDREREEMFLREEGIGEATLNDCPERPPSLGREGIEVALEETDGSTVLRRAIPDEKIVDPSWLKSSDASANGCARPAMNRDTRRRAPAYELGSRRLDDR
jgi:hypothetical protein